MIVYCYGPKLHKATIFDLIDHLNYIGAEGWEVFHIINFAEKDPELTEIDHSIFRALAKRQVD